MTNDPGDTNPTEPLPPAGPAWQAAPAAPPAPFPTQTWQWAGPHAGPQPAHVYGAVPGASPYGAVPPAPRPSAVSTRTRVLGAAAALVLAAGSAAGGVAFGYAHAGTSSSATGIASGQTPSPQGGSGQAPATPPSNDGGNTPQERRGGQSSSATPPGKATANQQIGVVDVFTRLKYEGAKAAGTGMIVSSDGEILTNNHVISGATKIKVIVVATGDKYVATVVGTDKVDDVAVLQLADASGLTPVRTDTGTVSVGDAVVAVGNAMGVGGIPSAAEGTITGLNRSITTQSEGSTEGERLTGMIQVDAHVISGDSGGPLYDSDDEVIGMNTAASASPAESTGFAIPISRALSIADQIERGDESGNITIGSPAFLGVQFAPGDAYTQDGAVISGVLPKTPAAKAGLVTGDTVTRVDDTAITSGSQLKTVLGQYEPDQSISLTWTDTRGTAHTETVTLIAGPAE